MKILHTADWHIGKRLHKAEFEQDHHLFFAWLKQYIAEAQVDVLLVSGDVFDTANPSAASQRLYYNTLLALKQLNCKIIVTGGNHDSAAILNAPRHLLAAMDIHVAGRLPENREEVLIPLEKDGKTLAVVAAVPFLRDGDLRKLGSHQNYETQSALIESGIAQIFEEVAKVCEEQYPGLPAIAMGHLFTHGASTSESEREIQIGNLAGFPSNRFPEHFTYIALGHIHKPQHSGKAVYSGSPLQFSFSERNDQKRVMLLELGSEGLQSQPVPLPQFRQLKKIQGTLEEIAAQLAQAAEQSPEIPLPTLVEVLLQEEAYSPSRLMELEQFLEAFQAPNLQVVKYRASFAKQVHSMTELYAPSTSLEDLSPGEVFAKLLEKQQTSEADTTLLQEAFAELLAQAQESC